ncbi:MAG TPA: penicillin-binding protein [Chloroflexi bacterium]|nr:penicillin-binding protein [Chloroflexota bacterium]
MAITLLSFALVVFSGAAAVLGVYAFYVQDLPSAEEIGRRSTETFETTRIYDRTGKILLYEFIPPDYGRRTEVPLERIPAHLRNGTVAMEDKTFYTNPLGINVEGVGRAVWGELTGENLGGGSSIAQQLIRNVIMTPEERMERSYERKIKEMILAFELTRRYPGIEGRDQILEWYLNNISYGRMAFGVEAAAQTYFGKHVEELSLAECAMLVPLGQSPALNPIDRPEEAKKRQEIVLDAMFLQGYITAEEAMAAKQETLVLAPPRFDIKAPHFVMYVRDELERRFGTEAVYGGGLQVITSIDLEAQAEAERIAREHIDTFREPHNAHNAAVVVLSTKTAEIIAMVGSLDYYDQAIDGQVNMAISPRQPGSSFKPFVYATAFAQGYTPATMVMDVRTSFPDGGNPAPYVPENYDRRFHGPMTLRRGLACSYNIPAVAAAHWVGIDRVVETARAMGVTSLNEPHYGLAVALGSEEVSPLEMAYAFSVFGNGGSLVGEATSSPAREGRRRLDPVAILEVKDARGNVLYAYEQPQRQEVLRAEVAFLVADVLSDNQARTPAFGANSVLVLKDRPAAVKTGTTNDYYDGWTVGFTPQYVTAVWVGNTDRTKMKNASGVRVAGPIWHDVMEWLHDGLPVESFERPEGIVTAIVDSVSGKLPTEYSPGRMQELFMEGTVPVEHDDVHRPIGICRESQKLATTYCPAEAVEQQVFSIYPPEADDWVREQGIPQPPKEYCPIHGPDLSGAAVAILQPGHFATIKGVVAVTGNARPDGFQRYRLEYGQGSAPGQWIPIGGEHGESIDNGVLEHWDTHGLEGLYTLRLIAVGDGGEHQATVQVLVDNTPPSVQIQAPTPDKFFYPGTDEWISIQVDARDNVAMDKVEFYIDDQLFGYSTVSPYTVRWMLRRAEGEGAFPVEPWGTHRIHVVAYDSAGNTTTSEPVTVHIGSKS